MEHAKNSMILKQIAGPKFCWFSLFEFSTAMAEMDCFLQRKHQKKGQGPVFVAYLCLIHSITINYYITEVQGVFTTSKSSQVQASFEDSDDQSLILYHPPQINAIQNGGKLLA